MIVENQSNVKVHFAGTELLDHFNCMNSVDVRYALFTVFPFIIGKMKNNSKVSYTDIPNIIHTNSSHSIMDSGLFSLMFGSYKGQKDLKFIEKWMHLLIEFINVTGYKGTYVEVDCQKVLGVDEAWRFRNYLKENVSNRIINVFHKEDGQKGLDKLIEFSDYIALSIPELRIMGKKDYTYRLANYIKNKKPNIDIHLLGCTENDLLQQCNFTSSSDSTSWLSVVRYGMFDMGDNKRHMRNLNMEELKNHYKDKIYKYKPDCNNKTLERLSILSYQSELLKIKYTKYAGSQD